MGTPRRDPEIRRWHELSPDELLAAKSEFTPDDFAVRRDAIGQYGDEWFVATMDNLIVGWLVVKWRGKPTHPEYPDLEDVWVREQWRNQGIGTSLIRFAEELATKRGCDRIGLAVNPTENSRGHALYERLGYADTGEPTYVDDVYGGHEDWVIDLAKLLT
jgi:GNAT superfamily N-acetyltransferase